MYHIGLFKVVWHNIVREIVAKRERCCQLCYLSLTIKMISMMIKMVGVTNRKIKKRGTD